MSSADGLDELERIDVYSHAITSKYRELLLQIGHDNPDGWPEIPASREFIENHIRVMKEPNITTSILSISTPGTYDKSFDTSLTKEITRTTNEELSEICAANPKYFRSPASLPLPSVPDSLAEIDYALDTLGASGFCVLLNANSVYLGDKSLDPMFDKLNQCKAILLMHPTSCKIVSCTRSLDSTTEHAQSGLDITIVNTLQHVPSGLLEYVFDEIRAVVNLLVSGTVTRCPEIKFVMSHAGCVLPPVPEFVAVALQSFFGGTMNSTEMRRLLTESFHFDLAGLPWPDMIHGLLGTVGPDRLVYGSDYCWTPVPMVKRLFEMMDQGANEIWTVDTIKEVYSGNAKRLFDL